MGPGHLLREAVLLAARHEVVDEDAELAIGARLELGHHRHHVVEAVHRFHHNAEFAEIVAPHMFHKLGVVLAFHPDSACGCEASTGLCGGCNRAAGSELRAAGGRARGWSGERDRLAVDEEAAWLVEEFAVASVSVAQGDGAGIALHDVAAERACTILHQ